MQTKQSLCPAQEAFKVLANKWSLMIIKELSEEKLRFNRIKSKIAGISSRELSKRLEVLEEIGAVNRNIISIKPIMVEYSLTEAGKDLTEAIEILHKWTIKNKKKFLNVKYLDLPI
jgi:DNA-binding HxlR family transcriptional regulator